jgi:hypothetical protein
MNDNIRHSKPLGCYLRSIYENLDTKLLALERDKSRPYLSLKLIFVNKKYKKKNLMVMMCTRLLHWGRCIEVASKAWKKVVCLLHEVI